MLALLASSASRGSGVTGARAFCGVARWAACREAEAREMLPHRKGADELGTHSPQHAIFILDGSAAALGWVVVSADLLRQKICAGTRSEHDAL